MAKRKIILFGGMFDPVHLGHTAVAAFAAEQIGAEVVIFVPAKRSPLKGFAPKGSDEDRFAMLAFAIAGNKKFQLSDCELKREGPSYTLETVRQFQTEYGSETAIYWLMGADSLDELPRWYKVTELIDECNLSVMFRAGCQRPDFTRFAGIWGTDRVKKLQRNVIRTPLVDISSTRIRNDLAAGRDAAGMLHPAVADYIKKRGLYR